MKFTIFLKRVKSVIARVNLVLCLNSNSSTHLGIIYLDNYDSFTYNSVDLLRQCGAEVLVFRNNQITIKQLVDFNPCALVIGPGPKRPEEAGISMEAIQYFYQKLPILGICLGHQCLGQFFGGNIIKAKKASHGMSVRVHHSQKGIFHDVPTPFKVALYNSLVVDHWVIHSELEVCALSESGEIMALQHAHYPLFGVQFHPESIVSEWGKKLLENFVRGYCNKT